MFVMPMSSPQRMRMLGCFVAMVCSFRFSSVEGCYAKSLLLFSISGGSDRYPPDSVKHFGAGIGLAEVSRAPRSFGVRARARIVVRGDEDDRNVPTLGRQLLGQFDTGHAAELDVEHQTAELRMLRVREERLR